MVADERSSWQTESVRVVSRAPAAARRDAPAPLFESLAGEVPMNRFLRGFAVWSLAALAVTASRAESPSDLAQTARRVASFQNPDGGFAPEVGGASTLGATSSSIRILKYTGGSIPDVLACVKYVQSCRDKDSGGFAPTPGGAPDVPTTATGLMALAELKWPDGSEVDDALDFLGKNARTFEQVRIAVAGAEAYNKVHEGMKGWAADVLKDRNADGTFGKGATRARETGGKAVALLRLKSPLENKEAVVAFLKEAQRPDGGWGQKEGESELETSYRIMRLFFMLKEKPDLDRLVTLVSRCRQADGRYGPRAGAEATLGGTYFATIILRWTRELGGEPAFPETAGFRSLFNGKDLTGWEGDASLWLARNGVLVGDSPGLKHNEFLATKESWGDSVLKLTFRMTGADSSNSGVQFRSVRVPGTEMSGYQADVGQNFWGCLYDESRRNKVLAQATDSAVKAIHKDAWNQYMIDAKSDHIRLFLNGVQSVNYHEADKEIARAGRAAVQVHAGEPMKVEFKNIYIQPLPTPKEDDGDSPGFHLRTLKADKEGRKYTVYIPQGDDGAKAFPVVLFLHGSGERGSDGVVSAQVGLGPAILNNPENFPAVAIFPQAKTTWKADSDDAKAALAALDEVLGSLKTDRGKVVLTGLSMGGSGSWELAAAHPGRFAAVVPICGRGQTDTAPTLAKIPVWTFCGDEDGVQTVRNMRALVEAVRASGGEAKLTEYRGVGHNSWDRAYSEPALIDWMLSRAKK